MSRAARVVEVGARDTAFGSLLQRWRTSRRLSQLALATEAGVSSRHLSFLESGRARPSREMVALLASVLEVPLGDRNALLLAAGYAPVYGERELRAPELEHVRRAIEFIVARQEPYPALVADARWDIVLTNGAARRIFGLFRAGSLPEDAARNAMHMVCHPDGLRSFIVNWEEFAGPLVQMLHREAASASSPVARRLRDAILGYPGIPASWRVADHDAPVSPVLTMRLERGGLALAFFSTLTTLATPRDVTLEGLKIECFYPADAATEQAAHRLAQDAGASGA